MCQVTLLQWRERTIYSLDGAFKTSQIQRNFHRCPDPVPWCSLLPYYYLTARLPEGTVNILPTAIPTIVSRQKKVGSLMHTLWIQIFGISQEIGTKGVWWSLFFWGGKKLPKGFYYRYWILCIYFSIKRSNIWQVGKKR